MTLTDMFIDHEDQQPSIDVDQYLDHAYYQEESEDLGDIGCSMIGIDLSDF